jgi:hypothetical protein
MSSRPCAIHGPLASGIEVSAVDQSRCMNRVDNYAATLRGVDYVIEFVAHGCGVWPSVEQKSI